MEYDYFYKLIAIFAKAPETAINVSPIPILVSIKSTPS
jgi:hypothetical protein